MLWFRSEVLMELKKYDLALRDLKLSLKKGLTVKIRGQYYKRLGDAYKGTYNYFSILCFDINLTDKLSFGSTSIF